MKFHDLPEFITANLAVRKAEICGFATLKDADHVAGLLTQLASANPDYNVMTFAAEWYYVVLITPDFIEDTDVTHANT